MKNIFFARFSWNQTEIWKCLKVSNFPNLQLLKFQNFHLRRISNKLFLMKISPEFEAKFLEKRVPKATITNHRSSQMSNAIADSQLFLHRFLTFFHFFSHQTFCFLHQTFFFFFLHELFLHQNIWFFRPNCLFFCIQLLLFLLLSNNFFTTKYLLYLHFTY